jgi:transcriptional regulator with XRE-family HTH domain
MEKSKKNLSARLVFAHNIRLARLELKMSQEDMAEACGLHRTYVGSVERGERNISIDNMDAMAKAVKKSLAELVFVTK